MIDVAKILALENKSETVSYEPGFSAVCYMGREYPVSCEPFKITIANVGGRQLLVSGETKAQLTMPCDRCLEQTRQELSLAIDGALPLNEGEIALGEKEVEEQEDRWVSETQIDVDQLLIEEILFQWPEKVLCKEDCKGICPVCGKNRNLGECDCDRQVLDPRMAKFLDVFAQASQ